jgi:hypothetical protein
MKITGAFKELGMFAAWLAALRDLGIQRLSDVRQHHLDAVKRSWQNLVVPGTVAARITVLQHVAAHAAFMTADKLTVMPWSGRPATQVAKRERADENVTPRIPEPIMAPVLRAALFYIESASDDILAARTMLEDLKRNPPAPCRSTGEAAARIGAYIQHLRGAGKGIPALPREQAHLRPGASIIDNVIQAPNLTLMGTLSGTRSTFHHKQLVEQAGRELGYQEGGLDCRIAAWPDTGRPWRAGFNPYTVEDETHHLRTAAWLVIAYLSGMRDAEIRELGRDCAFTAPGDDGRVRHKLRGRVFKGRKLTGDVAEWVVLDVVHRAVHVLQRINTDPTHLFGYQSAGQTRCRHRRAALPARGRGPPAGYLAGGQQRPRRRSRYRVAHRGRAARGPAGVTPPFGIGSESVEPRSWGLRTPL